MDRTALPSTEPRRRPGRPRRPGARRRRSPAARPGARPPRAGPAADGHGAPSDAAHPPRRLCRAHGHRLIAGDAAAGAAGSTLAGGTLVIEKGRNREQRWAAERAGSAAGPPDARADARWGLAARGRWWRRAVRRSARTGRSASTSGPMSRPGSTPPRRRPSGTRRPPSTGPRPSTRPPEIEGAVVQIMTYLVENEQAALIIPARLLSQLHPHYREVMQLLATQAADEARHVEVFTRRGLLSGGPLWHLLGRRPRVAGDAAQRAGLHHRVVPAVGARRGHLPRPAPLPARARAGHGHRRRDQARAARRGAARGVRRRAHRPPRRRPIPATWARSAGRSNAGTPRCRTPPA